MVQKWSFFSPFYETTKILGGKATVYRREPGEPFFWRYWIPAEKKRISKSQGTKDLGVAVQLGTEQTLDAMSKERSGVKVISGTIGDAIDAYEAKQMAHLARGEIRSEKKQKQTSLTYATTAERYGGLRLRCPK